MKVSKIVIIVLNIFVGWGLYSTTMGFGQTITSRQNVLIVHAIRAPIFFAVVSLLYFTRFNYTTPLQTAVNFVDVVIGVNFFVVALLILRSMEMFTSLLGTWIPFVMIFISTYLTGLFTLKRFEPKPE